MVAMVEVPVGLVVLASVYTAFTIVVGVVWGLATSPALVITRRKAAYFDDWNTGLKVPWLFWHIGGWWHRILELAGNYLTPAPQRVCDLVSAYFRSQVIITVNELGVPDALQAGPKSGAALAKELRVRQDWLERVLRVAARMELVALHTPRAGGPPLYALTQLSAVLCGGHVNSVKAMVSLFGDHWAAFGQLAPALRAGKVPYTLAHGMGHWDHMRAEPALWERFNKAMTCFNSLCPVEAAFLAYDFTAFDTLTDVAGGLGSLAAAALGAAPRLRARLFDLPDVIKEAQQLWAQHHPGLLPRITFSTGSFFEAGQLPAAQSSNEVYALRQILHDWSDEEACKILQEVRAAIGPHTGCKLVILEACIAAGQLSYMHTPRTCGDVHMLVAYGDAKERTDAQFRELLGAAGFRLARVIPTKSLFFVLEAEPV